MPTVHDLRTALNDVAADTPGLSSADMLRAGRAFRTRRRALATSSALVVLAGLGFGLTAGRDASTQAASSPIPRSSTAVVTIDQLFEANQEYQVDPGVHTRAFTYRSVPAAAGSQATVEVSRLTGGRELPDIGAGATEKRKTVKLKDVQVQAAFVPSDAGGKRLLKWQQNGDNYYLTTDTWDRTSDTGGVLPHGPSDNELYALVEWISEGN
jgi:hypothetical protein